MQQEGSNNNTDSEGEEELSPLSCETDVTITNNNSVSRIKHNIVGNGAPHSTNGHSTGGEVEVDSLGSNGFNIASLTQHSPRLNDAERFVVRLIGQHLDGLGLRKTSELLVKESGCKIETAVAQRFRQNIEAGSWDAALNDLKSLQVHLTRQTDYMQMRFIILEQKYLEQLEKGAVVEALNTLRTELSPMGVQTPRVHQLSTFLMCDGNEELRKVAGWEGSTVASRSALLTRVQYFLPPDVLLAPNRLQTLLRQAITHQYQACPLHNTAMASGSGDLLYEDSACILMDHSCSLSQFPTECRQMLTDHCDEVWCAQFSNDGRHLATGSKDSVVYIYIVDPMTKTLRKHRALDGHKNGAALLAWSPDDKHLAVVGGEDGPELWIWNVQDGKLRTCMLHHPDDIISAVSWQGDGERLVCGGQRGQFYQIDLDGTIMESWEGIRIRSLWCKKDGETVLAADSHDRIRSYQFNDTLDMTLIKEANPLMYFCLDTTERYALCTTKEQGLHLWDLETRTLVKRYKGSTHGEYISLNCFGGHMQRFVASGSEDGKVYIWQRAREDAFKVLIGHTGCVNAVTWNPTDPSMLVSCGDDGTVRLWTPANLAPPPPTPEDEEERVIVSYADGKGGEGGSGAMVGEGGETSNDSNTRGGGGSRRSAGGGSSTHRHHGVGHSSAPTSANNLSLHVGRGDRDRERLMMMTGIFHHERDRAAPPQPGRMQYNSWLSTGRHSYGSGSSSSNH